jgi:hypothetical protein
MRIGLLGKAACAAALCTRPRLIKAVASRVVRVFIEIIRMGIFIHLSQHCWDRK